MTKYVFYAPNPTTSNILSEEESTHACRVLRLQIGAEIQILDGNGHKYVAKITAIDAKKTTFTNLTIVEQQIDNPYTIALWVAPTKQMERIEWMVEKCTELGIHSIGFFTSRYSERKELKLNRLEKIAISALKQSKNLYLPKIHPLQPLKKVLEEVSKNNSGQNLFAYISWPPVKTLAHQLLKNQSYQMFIGPEGDFSPEESESMLAANFTPFSLGKAILRTETACIASTHAIHVLHDL